MAGRAGRRASAGDAGDLPQPVENHLRPRWGGRRLDSLEVDDGARLVRELRAQGLSEWTISGVLKAAAACSSSPGAGARGTARTRSRCWRAGERPKVSADARAAHLRGRRAGADARRGREPWRTLFRLAGVVGGRESELLGLWWENLDLRDLDAATMRFTHQVDRQGVRVPLKTEEARRRCRSRARRRRCCSSTRRGRCTPGREGVRVRDAQPGSRSASATCCRALYRRRRRLATAEGLPTFAELFEHDERGHLVVDERGEFVLRECRASELPPLPDFHALRHSAAMDCDDAEEARDLLRHKNSNVTRAIYRGALRRSRRESLRARMEARMEAADRNEAQEATSRVEAEVVELRGIGGVPQ